MSGYVRENRSDMRTTPESQATGPRQSQGPALSMIERELEVYFKTARKLEQDLQEQKALAEKAKEDHLLLQAKFLHLTTTSASSDAKVKEQTTKIRELERQLGMLRTKVRDLSERGLALEAEKKKWLAELRRYQVHVTQIGQRETAFKLRIQALENSDQLKNAQINQLQSQVTQEKERAEYSHRQIEETNRQTQGLRDELRRKETELSNRQGLSAEHQQKLQELSAQLVAARTELNRYRVSWGQMTAAQKNFQNLAQKQAHDLSRQSSVSKHQLDQLGQTLEHTRRMLTQAEESSKKERRDKQIALNCLHTAEARIEALANELEELKHRYSESVLDRSRGVHLL